MSRTDFEGTFVAAIEATYAAAPDPSRWPQTLQAIADVFQDVGALLVFARDDGSFGHIVSESLLPMLQDYWKSNMVGQDLRAMRGVERGVYLGRDALSDLDLVTSAEIEAHPLYVMLARHGLKYHVAAPVSPDPKVAVFIAVQRSIDKAPYRPDELTTMAKLCRHAEKALRLSIRLLDAELGNLGLRECFNRLGIGIFGLDSAGRVIFSNSAGEHLLGGVLSLADGQLAVSPPASSGDLERAVAGALRASPADPTFDSGPILINRQGVARSIAVHVLPVPRQVIPADEFLTHVRALVLAIDLDSQPLPDPAIVRDVLGLTLGEARVASLVGSGLPPRDAAQKLGITEETVRTALKRVFSKVGVSRQSELVALLTRLVLR